MILRAVLILLLAVFAYSVWQGTAVPGERKVILSHIIHCQNYPDQCRVRSGRAGSFRVAKRVNREVARKIKNCADRGRDTWRIDPRCGDCDDKATTVRARLLELGWPSADVLLMLVSHPQLGPHLVVETCNGKRCIVLDSLPRKYRPKRGYGNVIAKQSASDPRKWIKQ